ncbi:hypothetical protein LXL04_017530 [Taraxacum kok-saghyz]
MSSSGSGLNLENYLIPLEEINRATDNFSPQRCIGDGGFGKVYKGQLSKRWENRIAAIKRLDKDSHQGEHEFRNELEMFSKFHHKNIIAFIGYCDEGSERIIVSEYAANGSLNYHLGDPNKMRCITWIQRLKICLGAARGLDYLHSGLGEENRVIHRDMKSANILLDENFVAKVCDFGLSRFGPRNQQNTHVYTKAAGTPYYLDPTYHESNILQKESDVYSFGVVLFEMMSGMLVYRQRMIGKKKMPQSIIKFVRQYNPGKLHNLIDPYIKDQIDSRSFEIFKYIAYQCISLNLRERPKMVTVIKKIEMALNIELQKNYIERFTEEIRFSHGKPVAAFTIYKRLLEKKYIEAESTTAFDGLIYFFSSAIQVKENSKHMAYWLSNASTLLFLIQISLKRDGTSSVQKRRPPTFPLGKTTWEFGPSLYCVDDHAEVEVAAMVVQQVEGKKPALVFMQHLTGYIQKMYDIIFINLRKELGSILTSCIQEMSTGMLKSSSYWQKIIKLLDTFLNIFKENCMPIIIAQKIFTKVFSYINVELFNSLLDYRKRCTINNGRKLIDGFLVFEMWCQSGDERGTALNELQHIYQGAQFLIIAEEQTVSYTQIRAICPILSTPQLIKLCTHESYKDRKNLSDGFKESQRLTHGRSEDAIHDVNQKQLCFMRYQDEGLHGSLGWDAIEPTNPRTMTT